MLKMFSAIISGNVQGVWFRDSTLREAKKLSICGWVKNLPDGTVKVIAEGQEEKLTKFIDWLHIGSPRSQVEKVDLEWVKSSGEFSTFEIR